MLHTFLLDFIINLSRSTNNVNFNLTLWSKAVELKSKNNFVKRCVRSMSDWIFVLIFQIISNSHLRFKKFGLRVLCVSERKVLETSSALKELTDSQTYFDIFCTSFSTMGQKRHQLAREASIARPSVERINKIFDWWCLVKNSYLMRRSHFVLKKKGVCWNFAETVL